MSEQVCWLVVISGWLFSIWLAAAFWRCNKRTIELLRQQTQHSKDAKELIDRAVDDMRAMANAHREVNDTIAKIMRRNGR